jgi:hypothetical protein
VVTETKTLAQALAMLQTRLPDIKKTQTADVKTDKTRYKYSYADLAQITQRLMPILGELGLSFTARPTLSDDRFVLAYKLLHISGEFMGGEYPLPASGSPQAVGSAITYARRYCLCAITGAAPEDDDGAAAQAEADQDRRSAWRPPDAQRAPAAGDGAATKPQLQKLNILFSEAEWTDRGDRLRAASAIVGRELASATEMSRREASTVIDALQRVVADPDPALRLAELVGAEGRPA